MDKETFDTAMKLNHGRTLIEGDRVCLKKDDEHNEYFYIIAIFPDGRIYMRKTNYYNGISKKVIMFYDFLINFKGFYNYGRV